MIGPFARIEQGTTASTYRPEGSLAARDLPALPVRPTATTRVTPEGPGPVSRPATGDGQRPVSEAKSSNDVSRLLSLVADRTRLKILRILSQGERPVVALTAELRLPQPTVSHHLAWLRMMDLVFPRRQGKHVFYALGSAAQCDDAGVMTFTASDAVVTVTPNHRA